MPAQSRADTSAKPSNTEEYPTFHWDTNLGGFSVGKLPQTPVPFIFLRINIHFPSCSANSWNLLLNKQTVHKKRVKFHSYKLAIHIQMKINILILQRQTIRYLLHDPKSLFSLPVCSYPDSLWLYYHHLWT